MLNIQTKHILGSGVYGTVYLCDYNGKEAVVKFEKIIVSIQFDAEEIAVGELVSDAINIYFKYYSDFKDLLIKFFIETAGDLFSKMIL